MLRQSAFSLAFLLLAALAAAAPAGAQARLDGEIFLNEEDATAARSRAPDRNASPYLGPYGDQEPFQFEEKKKGAKNALYQRQIARWKDPLTLPHSRTECVKWSTGHIPFDGDYKICIGWKVQWQWMYVSAFIRVATASERDIGKAVDECFKDAAVAAAVALIVTGGSAALSTFEGVMKACLVTKLPDLVSVSAYTSSGWGPWE